MRFLDCLVCGPVFLAAGAPRYVFSVVPSPLAGEGGRRPGEGWSGARPLTPTPSPTAGRGEESRGPKHVLGGP